MISIINGLNLKEYIKIEDDVFMVSTVRLPKFSFLPDVEKYETCIFKGEDGDSEVIKIYYTEEEAISGHDKIITDIGNHIW